MMLPNPSLNADVPHAGLRPRNRPPVSFISLGLQRNKFRTAVTYVNRIPHTILGALFLWGLVGQATGQEFLFVSVEDSRRLLSVQDTFLARLSPFDRSARMKTDREVPEKEFLAFVASAALEWQQHEKDVIESAFRQILPALTRLSLPLPTEIKVIKTSGREEGNAPYTRGSAIILPTSVIALPGREIRRILAHELFHISSRTHPNLAKPLYDSIGFQYCGEIEFPASLASRRITNPDAPRNDYCIKLQVGEEKAWAVPILFSGASKYDSSSGGEFFQYLQLGFLLVEKPMDGGAPRALHDSQGVRLVGLQQVSGFFEQVGRNTDEIIHPEEILADNFALLVLGERDVPSPAVLAKIEKALARADAAEQRAAGETPKTARP